MATEFSFDVVSKVDLTEVKNAIDLAEREIENRRARNASSITRARIRLPSVGSCAMTTGYSGGACVRASHAG